MCDLCEALLWQELEARLKRNTQHDMAKAPAINRGINRGINNNNNGTDNEDK